MLLGGIFVIIAAIVRICMSLEATPSTMNINRWGIRETIAGILAVNMPIIRPILSKKFWTGGPVSVPDASYPDPSSGNGKSRAARAFRSNRRSKDAFEMLDPTDTSTFRSDTKGTTTMVKSHLSETLDGISERDLSDDTASEDLIIQRNRDGKFADQARGTNADLERGVAAHQHGGINVTTTYTVRPASSYSAELRTVPRAAASGAASTPAELDGNGRLGR